MALGSPSAVRRRLHQRAHRGQLFGGRKFEGASAAMAIAGEDSVEACGWYGCAAIGAVPVGSYGGCGTFEGTSVSG